MADAFMADLLIIGGGLVGSCAAMLGAERGRKVLLYRRGDQPAPTAETQRNQGWHQSGLNYSFGPEIATARMMRRAGKVLLDQLGLNAPRRGVMRLDGKESALIAERARDLGVEVAQISEATAARKLRGLYRSGAGSDYWEVPDGPFPEAHAMIIARNRARNAGAVMKEIETAVRLEEDPDSLCGVAAVIGDFRIGASGILVAAGAGTPALLRDLGILNVFKVVRTPLLLVTHPGVMSASLLVDRVQKYAMTQPLGGRLTFGIPFKENREIDPSDPAARRVFLEEQRALLDGFQTYTGLSLAREDYRFDAGFEIWRRSAKGLEKIMPIIEPHPRFERVVYALPGRATTALAVADEALEFLDPLEGLEVSIPHDLPGRDWDGNVSMYYEAAYDHCDDGGEE